MRRPKRSMSERAFHRGYICGADGRSSEACPHEKTEHRAQWLAGWRAGRGDRLSGLTGVAGLHQAHV